MKANRRKRASVKKCRYNCLAIVGNGFDLAHGLHSSYSDFVKNTDPSVFSPFQKYLVEYCGSDDNWSAFEDRINQLSESCFREIYVENRDLDALSEDIDRVNHVFRNIRDELAQYLSAERKRHTVHKRPAVKKYLKRKTKVLNFNYTDTAETYTHDVYYVHGSLAERCIVLGYDYRDEACLANYDNMCWGKTICRKELAFCRFIRNSLGLEKGSPEFQRLLLDYQMIDHFRHSGRGLEEEDFQKCSDERLMRDYLATEPANDLELLPTMDYTKIRTVAVMGHGIIADQVLLGQVLKKCTRLKKVVIFSHAGEPDAEYKTRAAFFAPFCKKIRKVSY